MNKSTKRLFKLTIAAFAGMYAYNRFVDSNAKRKNLLKTKDGKFYKWKDNDIFYTKIGNGKPVLLIHDTDTRSSSEEWSKITKKLAKTNTVYTIDLLGCGRSDKPSIQYTNYMYVQIISSFIKDVIGNSTSIAATNLSAAPVIMANSIDDTLFDKIILVNPVSIGQMQQIPNNNAKIRQIIINLPILGTFIYNKLMSPLKIDFIFRKRYYSRNQLISLKTEDTYYEAAHSKNSNGKYLYSSIHTNYININIKNAVKKIQKPVYIISSTDIKNNFDLVNQYHKLNSNIEIINISNSKLLPQLETPEKVISIFNKILSK